MSTPTGLEIIMDGETLIALIIRKEFEGTGITFFTPPELSQQLAYMRRPQGYVISPHIHREVKRDVRLTQEVLLVRRGKIRVDLYRRNQQLLCSKEVAAGEVIMLASGGHGVTFLEESEVIEVKQGPYTGEQDKIRFGEAPGRNAER